MGKKNVSEQHSGKELAEIKQLITSNKKLLSKLLLISKGQDICSMGMLLLNPAKVSSSVNFVQ